MKNILLSVSFITIVANGLAQYNTVAYQDLLLVNPSFAGSNEKTRIQANHRVSGGESLSDYQSFHLSADAYLAPAKSGLAFSGSFSGTRNVHNVMTAALTYAKYFSIQKQFRIIPSVQIGFAKQELNIGYHSVSMFAPPGPNYPWVQHNYFTMGAGLLLSCKNLYAGVSVANLNRPDVGFFSEERTSPLITVHASFNKKVSEKIALNVSAQISSVNKYTRSILSVNALLLGHLICGVGYNFTDTYSVNSGFKSGRWVLQVAYNRNVSALLPTPYAESWNLMCSATLRKKGKLTTPLNFEAW